MWEARTLAVEAPVAHWWDALRSYPKAPFWADGGSLEDECDDFGR